MKVISWLVGVLLFSLAALISRGVSAGEPEADSGAIRPTGLRANLVDEDHPYVKRGKARLRWRTFWLLHWEPVPGARAYELQYLTSEGTSSKTTKIAFPPLGLEVANGDNLKSAGLMQRDVQLATIQSLLSVRVSAHLGNGTRTAPTAWLPVGKEHP